MNTCMNRIAVAAFASAALIAGCNKSETAESEEATLVEQALKAAEASGFRPPDGGDGGELHIYTWSDYIATDVLDSFEKALGVKVIVETFDANEAMYAKLKAGGTGYDIVMPSSYQIGTMAKEGMIIPLDHAKCPNVKANFDPSFASQILDPTFKYNVPYAVTYTGLMYLKNKIPADTDVNSWAILGNPAMKGRISLLDDIREVIGAGLMYHGHSVNSTNAAEIAQAVEQVLAWRKNVRKFDAESYRTEVPSGATWIGHGYSNDSAQIIGGDEEEGLPARSDIGFALPREGFSVAFDEMVVVRDAKSRDLAYAFVNYLYDGEVAKANMEYVRGPSPVKPGIDALDADYRKLIVLDPETLGKGQILRNLDDRPEVMELYNRAWDRIRATKAGL